MNIQKTLLDEVPSSFLLSKILLDIAFSFVEVIILLDKYYLLSENDSSEERSSNEVVLSNKITRVDLTSSSSFLKNLSMNFMILLGFLNLFLLLLIVLA